MEHRVNVDLNQNQGEEHWLLCPSCNKETLHKVLVSAEIDERFDDGDELFINWDSYQIVQCQGCQTASFRRTHQDSEDIPADPNETQIPIAFIELYPKRIAGRRELPNSYLLPRQVSEIYRETLTALANNLLILAGIGIRALVEAVCKERQTTGRSLSQRIDDLVTQGVLTRDGAEILHSLRLMGNKAAHEVKPHGEDDLNIAFDVIEHLLNGVYVLPKMASRLPKRQKPT
jgi:hypothetical protein